MASETPVTITLTDAQCYEEATADAFEGILPPDPTADLRPFAIFMPFLSGGRNSSGHWDFGISVMCFDDTLSRYPISLLEPEHRPTAAMALASLVGDRTACKIGMTAIENQKKSTEFQVGARLICFPGGIVLENGQYLPKLPDNEAKSRRIIARYFEILRLPNLSAHRAMAFQKSVETFLWHRLWRDAYASRCFGRDHPLRGSPISVEAATASLLS